MVVAAGVFKARCLELMDRVDGTREEVTITKRGRPVARLVPIGSEAKGAGFGARAGSASIIGDLIAPIDEPWEVER